MESVRKEEDQVALADAECILIAIVGRVQGELWKSRGEGRRQPGQLVGAVPAVLLLIGFHDDVVAALPLAQKHEARIAEVRDTDLVSIKDQHRHGGGAISLRHLLSRAQGHLGALLDTRPIRHLNMG